MIVNLFGRFRSAAVRLSDLPPLIFRLVLAYGFYGPALHKLNDIEGTARWFAEDLHYPFPLLNVYMSLATELSGVVLLALGLATRLISIPLIVVMIVAITTVHLGNGFSCADNGWQIPFYFMIMLFSLIVTGAGRFSVDALIARKFV